MSSTAIQVAPSARDDFSGAAFERDGQLFLAPDPTLMRKFCAQPRGEKAESDLRTGRGLVITTEHIDRDGDIMRSTGADGGIDWSHYQQRNPLVMLQHGRGLTAFPVVGGNAVLERVTIENVPGWQASEWTWADTSLGRDIAGMWRDTILRTASVGVAPLVWHPIDKAGDRLDAEDDDMSLQQGWEIAASEGREWSIVAVPANPWASRKLWDAAYAKTATTYFDLAARKLAGVKEPDGEDPAVGPPPDDAGAECQECGSPLPANANYCPECGHEINPEEPEEEAQAPAPEPKAARAVPPQEIAHVLKEATLERCPGCRNVVPYARAAARLVEHRTKEGPLCETRALSGESTGPSLKTIVDLFRDDATEPPPDVLPTKAGGLGLLLLAASDLRTTPGRCGVILREVGTYLKDGRVL
ncbi:MAG: zinc ribbon domain-containing protein, partial [Gemmatimonadales bacterium]|nr:zinc ribbon domain-containing protein [Gemmatimonadales bacterium]